MLSRSRVVPLNSITVPRMELATALMAIQFTETVNSWVVLRFRRAIFRNDSAVGLYYIWNEKGRITTFVTSRMSAAYQCFLPDLWMHVAGKDNPVNMTLRDLKSQGELVVLQILVFAKLGTFNAQWNSLNWRSQGNYWNVRPKLLHAW